MFYDFARAYCLWSRATLSTRSQRYSPVNQQFTGGLPWFAVCSPMSVIDIGLPAKGKLTKDP